MKMKELRGKSSEELTALLAEKRGRLAELGFLAAQRKVKNVRERSVIRKDAARILTLLKTLTPNSSPLNPL